ncbi:MAG TPA: FAD-dependent monooxygenase [Micropepsaceae bacterium]|jgi:2-octaprenyl-6-methoxyphenol hydroxylase|nr:FAD-dependent monooxygenase [Micropepsaceae bacterium]
MVDEAFAIAARRGGVQMNPGAMQKDVVIAGGGLVGLTLALALAQGGLEVAVADPLTRAQMEDERFDGRVSALAFASVRMLMVLGLWDRLKKDAQPIDDILVNEGRVGRGPTPFSLHFDHREIGEPLGHIVENRHIRQALFASAAEEKRIAFFPGTSATGLTINAQRAVLTLSDGKNIEATLAVAADGRDSPLREAQAIATVGWNYDQTGIVITVSHERPHHGVAYEQFLPTGPFAILPMTGNRASLVWTERSAEAKRILALPQDKFTAEMIARFGTHLGEVAPIGPRWSYPLRLQLARAYAKDRFALAGDAAHTIHPLAGQGLNLGLKDVAALAETVLDAARLGLDWGQLDVLARYERWRRFDSFALAAVTDSMNRLFSNDIPPLKWARDLGLGVVDRIAPLRRFFMRHAGGDLGTLPRLLKGEAA